MPDKDTQQQAAGTPIETPPVEPKTPVEPKQTGPYLGSWQTREAAEEGLSHMQGQIDKQGNEIGTLRKQLEQSEKASMGLQDQIAKAEQVKTKATTDNDYASQQVKLQEQIANLDPMADDYSRSLASLMGQSNALAAQIQHDKTIGTATQMFQKELQERDVRATHKAFHRDNPDFNSPEMQAKIQDYLARDATGMADSLVAYREIQRDEALEKATQLETEGAELKKLLELKQGAEQTGKVITKGQPATSPAKQPKTTGAARDEGMQGALDALTARGG